MGDMASLWGYAVQGDMDEMGQKLLYTSLEIEKLKSEAMEEMQKNKKYVNQLIQLLKLAIQDRDEARNQLNNLIIYSAASAIPQYFRGGGDSPPLKPVMANSSITESNSFSKTHNYHSPTVDSLFDATVSPPPDMSVDRGTLIVEDLSAGRVLPRKGILLQAVLEAGPLLQTLMVSGPLPRWRNPPQMHPFQFPSVAINGGGSTENVGRFFSKSETLSHSYNFGSNYMKNGSLISSAIDTSGCFRFPKRQRFC